jgi:hypothetical protein
VPVEPTRQRVPVELVIRGSAAQPARMAH